jgi:3-hydroxyacyl-[acyl-carrier-protein] dehydratase
VRWIWIDRFELFEPGVRAVAIKNVSAAEDHLHDHFPGFPIMPASLMIEGMAQTAGILVGEARNFQEKVILAKIKRATFHGIVQPGETIRHDARIEQLTESAATTSGRITVGDELIGEVDIVFSHIDQNLSGLDFPEENFVFTEAFISLLNAFRQRSGERITL